MARSGQLSSCSYTAPYVPLLCCACACRGDILPTPTDLIDTVRDIVKQSGLTLIIEPGRSMVATSSALVNTVTGVWGQLATSCQGRRPQQWQGGVGQGAV